MYMYILFTGVTDRAVQMKLSKLVTLHKFFSSAGLSTFANFRGTSQTHNFLSHTA